MAPRLPTPEEWNRLQGGAPILLECPTRKIIEILHSHHNDKGEHDGTRVVVPTPRQQLFGSQLIHFTFGNQELAAPAVLLWKYHGQPCDESSDEPYVRLGPNQVDEYISGKEATGWKQYSL